MRIQDFFSLSYHRYHRAPYMRFILPTIIMAVIMGSYVGFLDANDPFIIARQTYPTFTLIMKIATNSAYALYCLYIYLIFDSIIRKDKIQGLFCLRGLFFHLLITGILVSLAKEALGIPRPGYDFPAQPWSGLWQYRAIPSGHSAEIIAITIPLALWVNKKKWFWMLSMLALVVGFSRIWLGVHHPLDVLVGVCFGLATAYFATTANPLRKTS